MASKRFRRGVWEFVIKRAGLLEKPLYANFPTEEAGDLWVRRVESMLDRGVVPTEHVADTEALTVASLISRYLGASAVKQKAREVLTAISKKIGDTPVSDITANWVDNWIAEQKRSDHAAPATIRAKVSALGAACDWAIRKEIIEMPGRPLRGLPRGYASYASDDIEHAETERTDEERDRRLDESGEEEKRILSVIGSGVLARKQRPYEIEHKEHVSALFLLALETCMRLSEMVTLTWDQVSFPRRGIWLDRTKNGDKRQVILSSPAVTLLKSLPRNGDCVFPWWEEQDWATRTDRAKQLKIVRNYLSKLFAQVFEEAQCADLRFHDLRHEAISRVFERTELRVEEIMKHTGHRTHKMMMRYLKLRDSHAADRFW